MGDSCQIEYILSYIVVVEQVGLIAQPLVKLGHLRVHCEIYQDIHHLHQGKVLH